MLIGMRHVTPRKKIIASVGKSPQGHVFCTHRAAWLTSTFQLMNHEVWLAV